MPILTPQIREQIRSASDIVEVVGSYLPLKRAGANFVALCPFHREKSPSFNVSPSRQAFHCFGCHKGGDVFRFVQDYENISFFDAAKRLADRAGIRLEFDTTPGQREESAIRERLREIHEQITQRWQNALANEACGEIARAYLTQRGVLPDAVRTFRLGYAPDAWDDTVNFARSKGWDIKLVETSGLVIPRESDNAGRGHYDRFRGRLMFPICDEQGRVIGFSGRVLQADVKTAKYVNSPETPIFTKSRVLFGLDKSKRAILDAGSAIICEGQLDLIACFSAGVQNVVAPQGTALTGEHLRILRRYAQEAVLCFDSDNAGQKAAARVLDDLLASGLSIRVITLPAPHDPDSYIKAHGPEAFRQLATTARDFFEFYLDYLCRQHDLHTDRGRLAVLESMAVALQKTGNEVLLDRYAQRTSMALAAAGGVALSPDAVRIEFKKRVAAAATAAARTAARALETEAVRAAHTQARAHAPAPAHPHSTPTPSSTSSPPSGTASPGPASSPAPHPTDPPPDDSPWPDDEQAPGMDHDEAPAPPPPPTEDWLLKLLFLEDDFAGWLALHLDVEWLVHPGVREIVRRRLAHQSEGIWESPAAFLGELEDEDLRGLASQAMADSRKIPNPVVQLTDVTTKIRNAWIEQQIARLSLRAAIPELADADRTALLHRLQDLRRQKRSPLLARVEPDAGF
jgi:DNA primase